MNKTLITVVIAVIIGVLAIIIDESIAALAFPLFLVTFFAAFTTLGDVLPAIVGIYNYVVDRKTIIPLAITSIVVVVLTTLLKLFINRPRPLSHTAVSIFGNAGASFPSMHTALAFAMIPFVPKYKYYVFAIAVLIGVSRIILHAHYLSDVIFGGLLGYLIGVFVKKWWDNETH